MAEHFQLGITRRQIIVRCIDRLIGCWVLALLAAFPAFAGSIGFSINFTGDDIAITSSGSEAAYQVSAWTLNVASQWQPISVLNGNTAYLPPGQGLNGRRAGAAADTALGRADPLLVLLRDQAGAPFTQLAWRQAPAAHRQPLPTQRSGARLSVAADGPQAQTIVASYALTVPYEGIKQLEQPLAASNAPPNPLRHVWRSGAPLLLDTGAGQAGVWLLHENANGALSVQVIPDGVVRGQEQVPTWLVGARRYVLHASAWLAALGALLLVGGWLVARRRSGAVGGGAGSQP